MEKVPDYADYLMRQQGLEYAVKLTDGHTIDYLSKDTAQVYADKRGSEIIRPMQGPHWPPYVTERQ